MLKRCKQFTESIYEKLYNVVLHLSRHDIKSAEALCIRLCGDIHAGRMLFRLLYWWPKSVKRTGEVYKSWRDWAAELCLTRAQVSRTHHEGYLEAVGVMRRQRQTAQGNPVHYLLDVDVFLAALAAFAGVSVETLLVWMDSKPLAENEDTACTETAQANTTLPSKIDTYNKNVVVSEPSDTSLLTIPGMKTVLLLKLLRDYGIERVQAMVDYALRKNANNVGGFVRRGLQENWEIEATAPAKTEFSGLKGEDFAAKKEDWTTYTESVKDYTGGEYADFIES